MSRNLLQHTPPAQDLYLVVTLTHNTEACRGQFKKDLSLYLRDGQLGSLLILHDSTAILWLSRVAALWDDYHTLNSTKTIAHYTIYATKADIPAPFLSLPPFLMHLFYDT